MRTRPSEEPKRTQKTADDLRALRGRQWVTRRRPHVDRIGWAWLIRRFVDRKAEVLFVPAPQVLEAAQREGATPYDVPNVEHLVAELAGGR